MNREKVARELLKLAKELAAERGSIGRMGEMVKNLKNTQISLSVELEEETDNRSKKAIALSDALVKVGKAITAVSNAVEAIKKADRI